MGKRGVIFGIVLVCLMGLIWAGHVITTSSGGTSFSVNEDTENLYNISINNTDAGQTANITSVNFTLPTSASCVFAGGSNATDSVGTFSNTSSVLSWTNSSVYLVNGSETKYFWFNLTCGMPGNYNITVTTTNSTSDYTSNLSLEVNDTSPFNLTACGTLSNQGTYLLNNNISSAGTCLTISNSSVILDCQGHTINFSQSTINTYGIYTSGYDNITIQGCNFEQANISANPKAAIFLGSSKNSTIYNNTAHLTNVSASTVGYGFYLDNSSGANVSFNVLNITDGPVLVYGIMLISGTNDSVVHANNVTTNSSNLSAGILPGLSSVATYSYRINVTNNRVYAYSGSSSGAIAISAGGSGHLIYNNYFSSPSYDYASVSGTAPFYSFQNLTSSLNTTKTAGTNIVGRSYIGGNYWTNPTGSGYSDYCANLDSDHICDSPYSLDTNNIDYLPLTNHTNTSTTEEEDSNSGSSVSVAGFWNKGTYEISENQFQEGYTRSLIARQRIRVSVGDENHHVGIVEVSGGGVVVEVSSTPQNATFVVGDSRKFEVTGDNFYDILVTLEDIVGSNAQITVQKINEEITEESIAEENQKENNATGSDLSDNTDADQETGEWGFNWKILLIIVLVLIVVGILFKWREKIKKILSSK